MTVTATCDRCGDWTREYSRANNARAALKTHLERRCQAPDDYEARDALARVPRFASLLTRYRLGIELARHGLRCGRQEEVVTILDGIIAGTITEGQLVDIIDRAAVLRTLDDIEAAGIDLRDYRHPAVA